MNFPTVINNAINGHDAIRFNGTNQYGITSAIPVVSTELTMYVVLKQITWTDLNCLLDIGHPSSYRSIRQISSTPNLELLGISSISLSPTLSLNTYGILTAIFNGVNSVFKLNNNASVIGDTGTTDSANLALAQNFDFTSGFANCEFAYIIVRNVADNTYTQNLFINYLKTRFAL